MRIHIATDHAGLETSHYLIQELTNLGHEVFDHGPQSFDPLDDYPAFCINAALAVQRDLQAEVPCPNGHESDARCPMEIPGLKFLSKPPF